MHRYIPQTPEEKAVKLRELNLKSASDLFSGIKRVSAPIPKGKSEIEVLSELNVMSEMNRKKTIFAGAGAYDHFVPAIVDRIASTDSFLTSYTPYQAEVSQGILRVFYEYQSYMVELTGLDVSNASLYDMADCAVEACAMALSVKKTAKYVVLSGTVHPNVISAVRTWAEGLNIKVIVTPEKNGKFVPHDICFESSVAIVLTQSPNYYGLVEDYSGLAEKLHKNGVLFGILADPMALAIYKTPDEWGADLAIGSTQPLGIPLSFGGPYCGYMTVRREFMRKIPGRIVGRTEDKNGKPCYTLTLQAREQHIKRERAVSNICSNQALMALRNTVYLTLKGSDGLRKTALECRDKSEMLARELNKIKGLNVPYIRQEFWREFVVDFETQAMRKKVYAALSKAGIFAGIRLAGSSLLVSVTEKRTLEELSLYADIVRRTVNE